MALTAAIVALVIEDASGFGAFDDASNSAVVDGLISETLEVSKRLKMAYVYAIAYITYGVFKAAETGDMSSLEQGWQLIRSECE